MSASVKTTTPLDGAPCASCGRGFEVERLDLGRTDARGRKLTEALLEPYMTWLEDGRQQFAHLRCATAPATTDAAIPAESTHQEALDL